MFSICRRCILTSSGPQTLRSRFLNLVQRSPHRFNSDLRLIKEEDIILYRFEKPRFFKIINYGAYFQLFCWAYFGEFVHSTLKNAPPVEVKDTAPWFLKLNLATNTARNILTASCLFFGGTIAFVAFLFTTRSVRYLILHKSSQYVSFVTYMPIGGNRIVKVPLRYVTTSVSRSTAKTYVCVKIRNHMFYYLLDTEGEFKLPYLFDSTVGVNRMF